MVNNKDNRVFMSRNYRSGPGCSKSGYPAASVLCFVNTYPLDSELSGG